MSQNKVQIESIMFDWRLYAERGLPSYLHHHEDGKRVDVCEIQFLNKVIFLVSLSGFCLLATINHSRMPLDKAVALF